MIENSENAIQLVVLILCALVAMFRAMKALPVGGELAAPLEFLLTDNAPFREKMPLIEDICFQSVLILNRQGLSQSRAAYLEEHAFEIMKKIQNPHIRALHIME